MPNKGLHCVSASRIVSSVALLAALMMAGCGGQPTPMAPTAPASEAIVVASTQTASSAPQMPSKGGGGGSGSARETLTGPAINGVVPSGQAVADMSQFASGGSTTLTVQISNVNLADGVVVQVTLDFTPVGTITLSRGAGTLVTSLGHFGVSRDQVRINYAGSTILAGGFFR